MESSIEKQSSLGLNLLGTGHDPAPPMEVYGVHLFRGMYARNAMR
jgi:hypothetical protein